MTQPTQTALTHALNALNPTHLTLDNESHMHAGYFDGKESHFKLVIVSAEFAGKRLAARHQAVYALANPFLMANGGTVHALAIHAYTPDEWQTLAQAPNSPNCAGQNKG
ncbi:BolA family transcriptional regulator [Moraxella caviae]|uniref:BolA family transcriptional regulator n=1 Tax=Moraxella caviae TaxID=34060 RepID=A0A1T0A0Z6_9GAMM|nr:BolA family protein [Moraxella caviae]OOR89453.1 BolA family transcriptional regulator [Moraxella caviae]STZ09823.1 transcriptional regulator BolA [Moraxella caviae]